jgi:hypothetical protein
MSCPCMFIRRWWATYALIDGATARNCAAIDWGRHFTRPPPSITCALCWSAVAVSTRQIDTNGYDCSSSCGESGIKWQTAAPRAAACRRDPQLTTAERRAAIVRSA